MPGIPAIPKNSAYSDHRNAAITPTLMSVSMVAPPCRALTQAARWKGSAPQTATGAARVNASHCQLSNCRGGIIDRSSTGSERAAEMSRRWRRVSVSEGASDASVPSPSRAGAGTVAVYPADSTAAMSAATSVFGVADTCAFSVA